MCFPTASWGDRRIAYDDKAALYPKIHIRHYEIPCEAGSELLLIRAEKGDGAEGGKGTISVLTGQEVP